MSNGIVIGKFMPLHSGHIALINFAKVQCDRLRVVMCYTENELIAGYIRKSWLEKKFANENKIEIVSVCYDENVLANTSVSSQLVSEQWAKHLSKVLPIQPDIIFSSEPYGFFLAKFMNCTHILFDEARKQIPVSAEQIRQDPFQSWDFIPSCVQPYFVKKVAIVGSESTGKSLLTTRLAAHFNTIFVEEMARYIVEHTEECTPEHLQKIAAAQASAILTGIPNANKILFVDTELNVTKSYSSFLFNKPLVTKPWIENANNFDLYLFLETDCPFIQDGTRLNENLREQLSFSHKRQLQEAGVNFVTIEGNWQQRFDQALSIITIKFFNKL